MRPPLSALFFAAPGLVLAFIGANAAISGFFVDLAGPEIERLQNGAPVETERAVVAAKLLRRQADRLSDTAVEEASFYLRAALDPHGGSPEMWAGAAEAARQAIAMAPLDQHAWAIVALVHGHHGDAATAREALRTSWLSRRITRAAAAARARAAIALWAGLEADDRSCAVRDFEALWREPSWRSELETLAGAPGAAEVMAEALADIPDAAAWAKALRAPAPRV